MLMFPDMSKDPVAKKDPVAVRRGKKGGRPKGVCKRLYGYTDVADLFGVTVPTVRKWFSRGGVLHQADLQTVVALYNERRMGIQRYSFYSPKGPDPSDPTGEVG